MNWGRLLLLARSIVTEVLDALLPPHARTLRTKGRGFADIPLHVTTHELLDTKIVTLMDYRKGEVQDLIRSLKYDGNEYAAHLCATMLTDYLREEIANIRAFSPRPIYIIPLPLHESRERERGFNQIELVMKRLPTEFRDSTLATVNHALIRSRATPRQTHLPRAERIRNVRGAFTVPDPDLIRHAHVFLVDDVTTTGATLANAMKPLVKAKAEVTLIALARA
jgi:competence protein ComFC